MLFPVLKAKYRLKTDTPNRGVEGMTGFRLYDRIHNDS